MSTIKMMPVAGINTVAEDAALMMGGDDPRLFVRDAVNVNITAKGKAQLRAGVTQVSSNRLKNLWQSPLHKDTFATVGDQWVKVDVATWATEPLATIGEGDISHMVLNSAVCVAGPAGIFTFNGSHAQRMAIDTPPSPIVMVEHGGSLTHGTYGVAVSWLRGGMESACSSTASVEATDGSALNIILPACFDPSVTKARLYLTKPDGGMLSRGEDYPVGTAQLSIPLLPGAGAEPPFMHCEPMPSGRYLSYWRGRLLTAKANVLQFSAAMAYHVHDARHDFIQMPQRITFIAPVDGGIWIGQVSHVVFLQGSEPNNLELRSKSSRAPVPGSAVIADAQDVGAGASPDGSAVAVWLADNGYVLGTSGGAMSEIHAGVMSGVSAACGTSVVLDRRIITAVT